MANNEPTYATGVDDERARCVVICEYWKRPAYIATHYGDLDAHDMKIWQTVVDLIEQQIRSGQRQPATE